MKDAFFKAKILWWLVCAAYGEWKTEVWRRDLDQPYCCPGKFHNQCGCGGITVRELYSYSHGEPNDHR